MENITPLETSDLSALTAKYSRFLTEVRKRIVFTLAVFGSAMIVGFFFYESIIRFLVELLSLKGINIVFTSPFQSINLAISCGVATGLVLTLPLIIIQVLSFLRPALKEKEYKMIVRFIPFCFILFIIGFSFGAFIMKWQIQIFLERSVSIGIGNILDISKLLNVVLMTSVLMGIGFQFPIVLLLFLRLGVITRSQLRAKRSWVYLASFLFAIVLPPDSILADILLSLPLIVLFELTLILDAASNKKAG